MKHFLLVDLNHSRTRLSKLATKSCSSRLHFASMRCRTCKVFPFDSIQLNSFGIALDTSSTLSSGNKLNEQRQSDEWIFMMIGRIDPSPTLKLPRSQIRVSAINSANPRLSVDTRRADELLSVSHSIKTRPNEWLFRGCAKANARHRILKAFGLIKVFVLPIEKGEALLIKTLRASKSIPSCNFPGASPTHTLTHSTRRLNSGEQLSWTF